MEELKNSLSSDELKNLVDSEPDINKALSLWYTYVQCKVDKYVPKIKLRKHNSAPWIDGDVIHLSNKKETARKLAKRTNSHKTLEKI